MTPAPLNYPLSSKCLLKGLVPETAYLALGATVGNEVEMPAQGLGA